MGVNSRTSPGSLLPADAVLIDLQLFGTFNVKSREAYGAEEAQASQTEAPDSGAGDLAQDGGDPQEAIDQGAGPATSLRAKSPRRTPGRTRRPTTRRKALRKALPSPRHKPGRRPPRARSG